MDSPYPAMMGLTTMLLVMKKNVAIITSATSRVMSRSLCGFPVYGFVLSVVLLLVSVVFTGFSRRVRSADSALADDGAMTVSSSGDELYRGNEKSAIRISRTADADLGD